MHTQKSQYAIHENQVVPIGNVLSVFKEQGFAHYKRFQPKLRALESPEVDWIEKQNIARELLRDLFDFLDKAMEQKTNFRECVSKKFKPKHREDYV